MPKKPGKTSSVWAALISWTVPPDPSSCPPHTCVPPGFLDAVKGLKFILGSVVHAWRVFTSPAYQTLAAFVLVFLLAPRVFYLPS